MSSFRDVVIDQKREWQTLLDRSYVKRDVVMPSGVENLARVVVVALIALGAGFNPILTGREPKGWEARRSSNRRLV